LFLQKRGKIRYNIKAGSDIFGSGFRQQFGKARVARNIVAAFPQRALDIIRGGQFQGGDLVLLKSEIHRPSFQERS
jgi:hypothetical protein